MPKNKCEPIVISSDESGGFDFDTDEMNLTGLPDLITRPELTHDLNKEHVRIALRKATSGATPFEISRIIRLSSQTVKKCLDELCSTREAYKLKRNRTTTMYYYNGKPRHDFGVERIEDGNTVFEISLAEGPDESILLHIVEKRFTLLEGEKIEGGVIIPVSQVPLIVDKMIGLSKLAGEGNGI